VLSRASGLLADTGLRLADLNGDGLTDAIKSTVETGSITDDLPGDFADAGVWLNDGAGWCDPATCTEAARYASPVSFAREFDTQDINNDDSTGQLAAQRWMVVSNAVSFDDVNGDGLVDVLRLDGSAGSTGRRTWIHQPAAASPPGSTVWVPDDVNEWFRGPSILVTQEEKEGGGIHWIVDRGTRLLDLDGSGTTDLVRSDNGLNVAHVSVVSHLDRLRRYENGQGGSVALTYVSAIVQRDATLEGEAAADIGPPPAGLGESAIAGILRWSPHPVVSQISVAGLAAGPYVTSFRYAHPRFCPLLQSGLGFRAVRSTLPDASIAKSFFWQAHGRAGRASRSEVWSGPSQAFSSRTTWAVLDGASVPGSLPGVHVGRVTQESAFNLYGGVQGAERTTSYTYDDGYGYSFVSGVSIARPTGTLAVTRVPLAADVSRWIFGRVASETLKNGSNVVLRSRSFGYDAQTGVLTSISRLVEPRGGGGTPDQATSVWTYDTYGNVRSSRDPELRTRYFCYDGDSDLGAGPGGCPSATTQTHTVIAGVRDALGATSSFTADVATGDLRSTLRFNGDRARIEADAFGRPTSIFVQPEGQSVETLIEERAYHDAPSGGSIGPFVEKFEYADTVTAPRTASYFDGLGRVARSVYETPTGYAGQAVFRDYAGRPLNETFDIACVDAHCTNLAAPQSPQRITAYDPLGRVLSQQEPSGTAAAQYSAQGGLDVVLASDANGNVVQHHMDGDRVVWADECAAGSSLASGCASPDRTKYAYEASGEVSVIYDALATSSAGYSDPRHQLAYTYDTLGRVLSTIDPDGGTSFTEYDRVGNVVTTTNARGQTTVYAYDALDRLEVVDRPGTEPTATITYDPHTRRRASVSEPGVYTITHAYDALGRERRRVLSTLGRTLVGDFELDLLGRPTKLTLPDSTVVTYGYEGAYLTQVCGAATLGACQSTPASYWVSDVTYDALGRVAAIQKPPGVETISYDPTTQRLEEIRFTSATAQVELALSYDFDPVGNVVEITDSRPGAATDGLSAGAEYEYDHRNRLTLRTLGGVTKHFAYDALGNLVTRDGDSSTPNQLYQHATKPHAITQGANGKSYLYDADGNVTQRGAGQFLTYDSASHLTCVGGVPGGCGTAVYRYDVDGNRISESFSGGQTIFFGDLFDWWTGTNSGFTHVTAFGQRIAEHVRANTTLRPAWTPPPGSLPFDLEDLGMPLAILAGLALLGLLGWLGAATAVREHPGMAAAATLVIASLVAPGQAFAGGGIPNEIIKRWITADHLGNAVLHSESGGATVKRRVFEPYGQVVAESADTEVTARLFTGQRYESRAGLYDFRARWYDAETGRFLSVDPVVQDVADPQTHNGYGYVLNNPVNRVDPDGRISKLAQFFLLLASIAIPFLYPLNPVLVAATAAVSVVAGGIAYAAGAKSWGLALMLQGAGTLAGAGIVVGIGAVATAVGNTALAAAASIGVGIAETVGSLAQIAIGVGTVAGGAVAATANESGGTVTEQGVPVPGPSEIQIAEHKTKRPSTWEKHSKPRSGGPERGDRNRTEWPRQKPEDWGRGKYPPEEGDRKGYRKFYRLFRYLPKGIKFPALPPMFEPLLNPRHYPTLEPYLPPEQDEIARAFQSGTPAG
jgi:RHS repeat-associated protein